MYYRYSILLNGVTGPYFYRTDLIRLGEDSARCVTSVTAVEFLPSFLNSVDCYTKLDIARRLPDGISFTLSHCYLISLT